MNNRTWFKGIQKCDGKWVEGFFSIDLRYHIITNPIKNKIYLIKPETLCQSIGYRDCARRRAFEHDIVLYNKNGVDHKGEIVYRDGKFEIAWFKNRAFRQDVDFWFKNREVKIIGNRFDSKSE